MKREDAKRIIQDLQIDVFAVIKKIEVGKIKPEEAYADIAYLFFQAELLHK